MVVFWEFSHFDLHHLYSSTKVREKFLVHQIHIEAQCYAVGYYEKVGFVPCSEEFMLDGIPHIEMLFTL
ncbi:MAG TPA: GNAT family N-acetyltransferase [Candidatus Faecimorpha stercoravium]|nr:GNAT family N-acetyltransferase [Candidatus Faecimorpha stercoravium]